MEVFEGPQLRAPTIGLITSAELVPTDNDRWWSGFDLILEGCEDNKVATVCPDQFSSPKTVTATGGNKSYTPYALYATDKCSTFPAQRDFVGRATRKLLAGESAALEEQLWSGTVGGTSVGTNEKLAQVGVTSLAASTVTTTKDALAILEQKISECSSGQGMVHIRPQALHSLVENGVVRRVGNIYLTPMDNILVPGRGYPGTGPTGQAVGATEWMFGHPGIVQIRRSEIMPVGDTTSQVIRSTNDRLVIVERVVHAALDTSCCVYAIDFNSLPLS